MNPKIEPLVWQVAAAILGAILVVAENNTPVTPDGSLTVIGMMVAAELCRRLLVIVREYIAEDEAE